MKKFLVAIVLVFSVLGITSCSEKTETPLKNQETRRLISEADQLQRHIKEERLLRNVDEDTKVAIESLIKQIKFSLLRLQKKPSNQAALDILGRQLQTLRKQLVVREDQRQLQVFIQKVSSLMNRLTKAYGFKPSNFHLKSWPLLTYTFSEGLYPFASFSQDTPWEKDVQQQEYFVETGGSRTAEAWLLSPRYNFSDTNDPGFRFKHSINIFRRKAAKKELNRLLIKNNVLKVKVSPNYIEGDPKAGGVKWYDVEVPMPATFDFYTEYSPYIDLSTYMFGSQDLTIAFVYDHDEVKYGAHNVFWRIFELEIFGSGQVPRFPKRSRPLMSFVFNSKNFDPFQTYEVLPDGARWKPAGRPNSPNIEWAKIQPRKEPSDAWLISPRYKLKDRDQLSLVISETVRNPRFEDFKILISTDYKGGSPLNANWEEVEHQADVKPDTWSDIVIGPIDLMKYKDQSITLAFRFLDEGTDAFVVWEIAEIQIFGVGKEIIPEKLEVQ